MNDPITFSEVLIGTLIAACLVLAYFLARAVAQRDYCARQWGEAMEALRDNRRLCCDVCGGKPNALVVRDNVLTVYCAEHTPFDDDDEEDEDDDFDRQIKDPEAWKSR